MAAKSLYIVGRYLPNPEESQDMVDAETIEIVAQLAEAFLPPTEMIDKIKDALLLIT